MSRALIKYDEMCRAIDAAYKVDEVKGIRDQAAALEMYSRQARNIEAERRACEIRLRAERKAGQLSTKLDKAQGKRTDKQLSPAAGPSSKKAQLRNAGISKHQAAQWEKLAAVPDENFEKSLADPTRTPTTSGIIRENTVPKGPRVKPEALWLWGRLMDFEREGVLEKDPAEILETASDDMLDGIHRVAPRISAWLRRIGKATHGQEK